MSSLTITDFHHSLLKENKHQLFTNEKIDVFLCWYESLEKEKEYYSLYEKFIPMKDLLKYIA